MKNTAQCFAYRKKVMSHLATDRWLEYFRLLSIDWIIVIMSLCIFFFCCCVCDTTAIVYDSYQASLFGLCFEIDKFALLNVNLLMSSSSHT